MDAVCLDFLYELDGSGSLIYMSDGGDTWNYSYGPLDRLHKVYLNGSITAKYTYDSGGRRVRSWDSVDGSVDYVYSGLNVVDEINSGVHERHVYAGGMHVASNSSGTVEYYHVDHLGSTRLKTNATGGVVYESNYEPYGPGFDESGSEDYRYTGKPQDPTGLYYFGARYYDPDTGRFTTRDTVLGDLTDPQSLNRYAYCRNNPNKYTDPNGKSATPLDEIAITEFGKFLTSCGILAIEAPILMYAVLATTGIATMTHLRIELESDAKGREARREYTRKTGDTDPEMRQIIL